MKLLEFINKHKNWKELLQQPPYSLIVKEKDDYTLLKYNQLESDFSNKIVKECRGIILNKDNKIVCFPFVKFFNYGEQYADSIDWSTARVLEKIDGSLIKLWYDKDTWMWSTNGNIDADSLPLELDPLTSLKCSAKTWGDLIRSAVNYSNLDFSKLNKNYTYMFELVSPFTTVVIPYEEIKLYHLATRDNINYKEVEVDIGIEKPKSYPLRTLDDCVKATEQMDKSHEGFVVVDGNYHRVKIKNPLYLKMHRMANNGNITIRGLLQLIEAGDEDEFLSYFPQYTKEVNLIKGIIETYKFQMQTDYNQVKIFTKGKERKEIAIYINNNVKWKDYCFYKLFKNSEIDPAVYLFVVLQGDNLLKMIAKDLKEGEMNA